MPKNVTGCRTCFQRRIECDETRPKCNKCFRKGLKCSGYGIIYRFNGDVAAQANPARRQLSERDMQGTLMQRGQSVPSLLWWPDGTKTALLNSDPIRSNCAPTIVTEGCDANLHAKHAIETNEPSTINDMYQQTARLMSDSPVLTAFARWKCPVCNLSHPSGFPCTSNLIAASLELMDHQTRSHFAYFSTNIAPVMVVLDGKYNGYRDLILPLACQDELVKAAVSIVSMQHLASQQSESVVLADASFQLVLQTLRRRANLQSTLSNDVSAWTTIIILLTGETVTGNSNFSSLFRLLQLLAEANKNTESSHKSALHKFLVEQTSMMTLFAQPLLGDTRAMMSLRTRPDAYFDFITNAAAYHPHLKHQTDIYKRAILYASDIYLSRANHVDSSPPTDSEVQSAETMTARNVKALRELCEQIDPSTPGHHTLVWVYFVAAAESSSQADRDFFTNRLREVFSRTRFRNIPIAINALQEIWKVQAERNWTDILPQILPVFII